jgi:hypothetical protein
VEDAAGIALAVGGITAANELFFAPASGNAAKSFNFRIIPATVIFALMLEGLSKLSPKLATGVGVTALVTVLFTRVGNAPAPIENADQILGFNKAGTVAKQQSVAGLLGG